MYVDYRIDQDKTRLRKWKLLYSIPCVLVILVMLINLKTGWIFTIREGNVYHSGRYANWVFLPPLIYFLLSLLNLFRANKRLAVIGLVLIVIRLFWQLWFPEVSSTSFVFALMLVCTRLYEMDSPLLEEAQP